MFPFCFAAIPGVAGLKMPPWYLERDTALVPLEQLLGSLLVGAT